MGGLLHYRNPRRSRVSDPSLFTGQGTAHNDPVHRSQAGLYSEFLIYSIGRLIDRVFCCVLRVANRLLCVAFSFLGRAFRLKFVRPNGRTETLLALRVEVFCCRCKAAHKASRRIGFLSRRMIGQQILDNTTPA